MLHSFTGFFIFPRTAAHNRTESRGKLARIVVTEHSCDLCHAVLCFFYVMDRLVHLIMLDKCIIRFSVYFTETALKRRLSDPILLHKLRNRKAAVRMRNNLFVDRTHLIIILLPIIAFLRLFLLRCYHTDQ